MKIMKKAIDGYIATAMAEDESQWPSIPAPVLPVPEEISLQSAEENTTRVEAALDSVVSIETDTGHIGSGFFVSPSCLVVTNEHVVTGAEVIIARTTSKALLTANLVSKDGERDLALLRTNARTCKGLVLENNPRVGQEVFAIGSPLGLSNTITRGIISAFRETPAGIHYIQIDAALNPGNSGGPLITRSNSVVGVNTWQFKGTQGLNFAVSASEIKLAFSTILH